MATLPLFVHSDIDDMTDLTPNALRVYMHLARRANKEGVAWPSYQTIGDHCFASVSENPVTRRSMTRKAIDELIAAKLIEKENRQNDGGHTSNAYLLVGAVSIGIPMPIDTAMPHNEETMPIDTAMPNGTKDTLIEDTPLKDTPEEKEKAQARDPLAVAWQQVYVEVEMPPKLAKSLRELVAECGMAATIHGIKQSAAKKDGRNFRYIAECARNYLPPPPIANNNANYANGKSYQVEAHIPDIPGVVVMQPTGDAPKPPPKPAAPMQHDDVWAICLAELVPTLSSQAAEWLRDSRLSDERELAGEPFYQVLVTHPKADLQWLTQQTEPVIRRKLRTLLGKRVLIGFVAVEVAVSP